VVGTGQRIGAENRWRSIAPVSPGALVGYVFCELMPTLCLWANGRAWLRGSCWGPIRIRFR